MLLAGGVVALGAVVPLRVGMAQTPQIADSRPVIARPPAPTAAELFAGLELSEVQRAKLIAVTKRARGERMALMGGKAVGSRLTAAEVAGLERIAAGQRAAIEAVLTPAQRATLAANLAAVQTIARIWHDSVAREAPTPEAPAPRDGGAR